MKTITPSVTQTFKVIVFRSVDDLNFITNQSATNSSNKLPHDIFKLSISSYSYGLIADEQPTDGFFKTKTLGTIMSIDNGSLDIQIFHKNAKQIGKPHEQIHLNFIDYRSWGPKSQKRTSTFHHDILKDYNLLLSCQKTLH